MKRYYSVIGLMCVILLMIPTVIFAVGNESTTIPSGQTAEEKVPKDSCTGIYVGKEASTDGHIYIGHCEDNAHGGHCHKNIIIQERVEDVPGRYLEDPDLKIKLALPPTTYKYITMPTDANTGGWYDSGAINEYGLAVTDSITVYPQDWVLEADPKKEGGLQESVIPALIAGCAKTAREGINVLIRYLKQYGAQDFGFGMIADQNEAWLFEIFSGSRYVAVKLPDDAVAVFGNESLLKTLDEYEEMLYSDDIESFAEENGHAVKDISGKLRLDRTFIKPAENWEHMRTWIGHELLAPSESRPYHLNDEYPLTYKPDQSVDIDQLTALFRNRYDGTPFSEDHRSELSYLGKWYPIGNQGSAEAHILDVDPKIDQSRSTTMYVALGEAEHSIFIPINNITSHLPENMANGGALYREEYPSESLFWNLQRLNSFAGNDRQIFSSGIRSAWAYLEKIYIEKMKAAQSELTAEKADAMTAAIADEAMDTAHVLFEQLTDFIMANTEVADNGYAKTDPVCQVPADHLVKTKGYTLTFDSDQQGATLSKGDTAYHFTHFDTQCEKTVGENTEQIEMNTFAIIRDGRLFIPVFAEPISAERINVPADHMPDTSSADIGNVLFMVMGCLLVIGALAIVGRNNPKEKH